MSNLMHENRLFGRYAYFNRLCIAYNLAKQ